MLHSFPSLMCLLTVVWLSALPSTAQAHAVHSQNLDTVLPIVLQFTYSTGDAARYTGIEVFSPENRSLEYQNGRTDQQGRFSFTPNKVGEWLVVMQDNMGHKLEVPVQVQHLSPAALASTGADGATAEGATAAAITPRSAQASPSTTLKALLGLSVLLNILIAWYWYKKRRESRAY